MRIPGTACSGDARQLSWRQAGQRPGPLPGVCQPGTNRPADRWTGGWVGVPPLPEEEPRGRSSQMRGLVILDWDWGWARAWRRGGRRSRRCGPATEEPGDGPEGAVPLRCQAWLGHRPAARAGAGKAGGDQGACAEGRPWAGRVPGLSPCPSQGQAVRPGAQARPGGGGGEPGHPQGGALSLWPPVCACRWKRSLREGAPGHRAGGRGDLFLRRGLLRREERAL